MVLPILKYGQPVLRKKGARIERVTPGISRLIADMFETMQEARGVGLAAQQVGYALQLTVLDVREVIDRPSTLQLDGQPADVNSFMPLVLINPEIKPLSAKVTGPEGCLSFPEMYADISRPESISVSALDERGKPKAFQCGGLLAKAIQHELDHLNGILFIDRMSAEDKLKLKPQLVALRAATQVALAHKNG
ncbi:MAG: peptide deformylase [Candidatus Omnitrophica bacterium]|nr:peptide deformylase [Candidatus Omnitrophota bacterium]